MWRYQARIEYDGTAYHGFQRQRADQLTIQGELEKALTRITNRPVTILGAGRTDSGVHATGQVIAFDLDWQHGDLALRNALNANLPDDIAVLQLQNCPASFHPRFDAKSRTYVYRICESAVPRPLQRYHSWQVRQPLDVAAMNTAAATLVGVHDFATFGRPPRGENSVRQVMAASWQAEPELYLFTIEANAFLYRMVRTVVGCLKAVGEGTWRVADFVNAFQAQDRRYVTALAPPQGLYLVAVTY